MNSVILGILLCMGTGQAVYSDDFMEDIEKADKKVILEQYEAAKAIYQDIIDAAEPSVIEAYAYYKLGSLYTKQNQAALARAEYEKGLVSLKEAGESNHQIAAFLTRALGSVLN